MGGRYSTPPTSLVFIILPEYRTGDLSRPLNAAFASFGKPAGKPDGKLVGNPTTPDFLLSPGLATMNFHPEPAGELPNSGYWCSGAVPQIQDTSEPERRTMAARKSYITYSTKTFSEAGVDLKFDCC